jgi:hypothetical protein
MKRTIRKLNAIAQAQLIKYMLEGIHSCQELAELSGLHVITVYQYARELHKAGAAHISAWEKDARGRDVIKIYSLGPGKDKKRERMTPAQRQAKARSKRQHIDMMHRMAA